MGLGAADSMSKPEFEAYGLPFGTAEERIGAVRETIAALHAPELALPQVAVPKTCPGVDSDILHPVNTWDDPKAFEERAKKLAADFAAHYDKAYGSAGIDPAVAAECPGE